MKNGFKVIDADMHVLEPAELWLEYIDPEYKDRAPIGRNEYDTDVYLEHEGKLISRWPAEAEFEGDLVETLAGAHGRTDLFARYQQRGWGPDVQIDAMDAEGIDLAVLFPSRGLFAHAKEYDDDGLAAAISRAYNDWLGAFCAHDPGRMFGAAMVPAQALGAAVEEVRRTKREYGFKAIFLRPNPVSGRNWHDPYYDPLWAVCEKEDMAVGFHEGVPCELPVAMGERFSGAHEDQWMTEHVAAHPIEQMYACLSMINGGACARFPGLRVAFLEGNCSWVPFWLWRMDEHYEHREKRVKDRMPLRPSEYFKRQCFAAIEADEEVGRYAIDWLGGDNIVFSTDFPHPDSRFPNSVETLIEQPFPEAATRKILWDNCARLYNID